MRIVFFGTPLFAAEILRSLREMSCEVVGVVTMPDRPKGRSLRLAYSAVKEVAIECFPAVPLWQPEKVSSEAMADTLRAVCPDLFLVVAYGEIIKETILQIPRQGCVNIHASLLPFYRGASPIQAALRQGDAFSGVTFMEMVCKMDAGPILKQERVGISPDTNAKSLEEDLLRITIQALPEFLENMPRYFAEKVPQKEAEATYVHKITSADCVIQWHLSAEEIHNHIRSLAPVPGAYTSLIGGEEKKRLKILSSSWTKTSGKGALGSLDLISGGIVCGQGVLIPGSVQLEGRKSLSFYDFLRGYPSESYFQLK